MSIQTARIEFTNNERGMLVITVRTPHGHVEVTIPTCHDWSGLSAHVPFHPLPEPKLKRVPAKRQKRASIKQEENIMEELGGRRHPGSGAIPGLKGDGRVRDKYRVEAKHTRQSGFRIDRRDLNKIRGECTGSEVPLYVVGFVDPLTGGSEDRWVMLPFEVFQRMDKADAAHLNR